MIIGDMDMTQQIAVIVQRLRHIVFFDIHVIEITDNLHMFQVVFDDIAARVGQGC
ncbi:Uncharacterised protein [Salmonella enterica subsp. arizonae]|uniref:Uncharacterized protein n=1 Tax=Salmonella enterica subsp. arizonae TaxID=59203 RepID=A0A379SY26_SALER|nr:Uncharacterised protein [Salmonella enterica subsp. arizonae]